VTATASQRQPVRWYLDTSAALKLLIDEPESQPLAEAIAEAGAEPCGTRLLETELRRAAHRLPGLHQDRITALLSGIDIYDLPAALYRQAGLLPGRHLRSLDALHLAAAISLGVDAIATYDHRLAVAAHQAGIKVSAPPAA
jgi:predicted nucleic acid-binding protein